jgi:hypothetical protein
MDMRQDRQVGIRRRMHRGRDDSNGGSIVLILAFSRLFTPSRPATIGVEEIFVPNGAREPELEVGIVALGICDTLKLPRPRKAGGQHLGELLSLIREMKND